MLRLTEVTLAGWAAVGALTALSVGAIGATLIFAGGRAVLGGSLTLGDLAMYALFTGLVAAPLIQVAQVGTQLSDAIAGLERARDLLDQPTEGSGTSSGEPSARLDGAGEMEDVSFEYRAGVPALRNVSVAVPAG
jgi:subfamily B ATP-binding cassette protein MsbA